MTSFNSYLVGLPGFIRFAAPRPARFWAFHVLLAAGTLEAQQVLYGSREGGNVQIFWSHGRESFGAYTHRYRFVSTLANSIRLCFDVSYSAKDGPRITQLAPSIRPGENASAGQWFMTNSTDDPRTGPATDCTPGPRENGGNAAGPTNTGGSRVGTGSSAADVRNQIAEIQNRARQSNQAVETVLMGLAGFFEGFAAKSIAEMGRFRDEEEVEAREEFTRRMSEATSASEAARVIDSRIENLEYDVRDAEREMRDEQRQAAESRQEAALARRNGYAANASLAEAYARARDGRARQETARVQRLNAELAALSVSRSRFPCCDDDEIPSVPAAPPPPAAPRPAAAAPPAPPPAPARRTIPGTEWEPTGIRLHEGPRTGVAWAEQRYATGFSRASSRYLFIGLTFSGRAGAPTNALLQCSVSNSGWQTSVARPMGTFDPAWSSVNLTMPPVGWDSPSWALGPYHVRCTSGDFVVGETDFQIQQQPFENRGWTATDLRLFTATDGRRSYAWRFPRATLTNLFVDLTFGHIPDTSLGYDIDCAYDGPGTQARFVLQPKPQPGANTTAVGLGWGYATAGNWLPGQYTVSCSIGPILLGSAAFVIDP